MCCNKMFLPNMSAALMLLTLLGLTRALQAQSSGGPARPADPGVRICIFVNGNCESTVSAGQRLPNLSDAEVNFFTNAETRFEQTQIVTGTTTGNEGIGLGPRFNLNQCSACHTQPAVGGSSPETSVFPNIPGFNPEFEAINNNVAFSPNVVPYFVLKNGPVREARFPFVISNGQVTTKPDGGVHDIFTIQGNPLAPDCTLAQPDFNTAKNLGDIIFRIPTPVFGMGFLENIGESTLFGNATSQMSNNLGIETEFNHSGNDGTISRFGWKAQNKSALLFAGEAFNVEMGVTNELFQNERPSPDEEESFTPLPSGCLLNPTPEDKTNFTVTSMSPQSVQNAEVPSNIVMFAMFMRFLDQPSPVPQGSDYGTATVSDVSAASIQLGQQAFNSVGCSVCHTASLTTDASSFDPDDLGQKPANLFSDLEIHDMGLLADNVMQGNAGGTQFRTAPLWGVGQRIFFLHDGRANDLYTAIEDHCITPPSGTAQTSEACTVVENFNTLPALPGGSTASRQDVLNFLRSL